MWFNGNIMDGNTAEDQAAKAVEKRGNLKPHPISLTTFRVILAFTTKLLAGKIKLPLGIP